MKSSNITNSGLPEPWLSLFTQISFLRQPRARGVSKNNFLAVLFAFICALAGGFSTTAQAQSPVVWVNQVNATATGNTLEKTSGQWDAGANSQQQITAVGGYVEFRVSANLRLQVGLSNDTSAAVDYTQLKYTFNIWGGPTGDFDIREGWGNLRYSASGATANDVFRIAVESGTVKYYRNGTLLYTSSVAPTYPLVLDTALTSMGATVQNAVITTQSTGSGIKTDLGTYPEPALPPLPAAGGKFIDPTFGTEIMRVTDQTDGQSNGTFYSYWPTFNINNTKLLVRRANGDAIYDFDPVNFSLGAKQSIPLLPDGGVLITEGAIWSGTEANTLFGLAWNGPRLWSLNVSTNSYSLVRDFGNVLSTGDFLWQMTMSIDGDTFAFTRKNSQAQVVGYVVYRRSTNQVLLNVVDSSINEVQLDKSGRYLGIPRDLDASGYDYYIRDLQTGSNTGLVPGTPDFSPGHLDIGTAMMVGFDNDDNRLLRRSLSTPHQWISVFNIGSIWQSFHVSLRGDNEGWVLVGFYGTPFPNQSQAFPLQRELVLFKTDGSQSVRRVAHHRSIYVDGSGPEHYWDTPRANLSRDGTLIAFTSNWGGANRQDLFIVKIPPSP